jgi:hypothetical protein
MKLTFNINEDIDRIETGNTVYISGLHGKEFKFINNKYGTVKSIYVRHDGTQLAHIADIELLNTKKIYSVNLDFIYKLTINNCVDNMVQHVVTVDNPMIYYIKKKSLIKTVCFFDELGQYTSLCTDLKGKSHVLLFSGVN